MNQKPSGIPVLFGIDAIHGPNYTLGSALFPQQLGLASTWSTQIAEMAGKIIAYETRASGITWTLAPVLDMGRDQLQPGLVETFGEDVLLTSKMGAAMVRGFQGDSVAAKDRVAVCIKHFHRYSTAYLEHDQTPTQRQASEMQSYVVPAFQAAIDAGAKSILVSSRELDDTNVRIDKTILIDLLRHKMGFKGVVLTNWRDIEALISEYKVAKDELDAIAMAINFGVDMTMVPVHAEFPLKLKELVENGDISMTRIDEAVSRIIQMKLDLGLLENPYYDFDSYEEVGGRQHRGAAAHAARKSIILAKNEGKLLPLNTKNSIFVTGPTAANIDALSGGRTRTLLGDDEIKDPPKPVHVLGAIQERFGTELVSYEPGATYDRTLDLNAARRKASQADVVVVCLGEMASKEEPDNLNLPAAQYELVRELAKTGKPIVLIMIQSRPRIIEDIEPMVDAVVLSFLPGDFGGLALSDFIAGASRPGGKLPITYPRNADDLYAYDHKRTDPENREIDMSGEQPQWPFGHGLSYTAFEYSNMSLSSTVLKKGEVLEISFDMRNVGDMPGAEVVQLYVSDQAASTTPAVRRLRGFEAVSLSPRSKRSFRMQLEMKDLAYMNEDLEWINEPGKFTLEIGTLKADFEYAPE
jgi:beta-glucosidase